MRHYKFLLETQIFKEKSESLWSKWLPISGFCRRGYAQLEWLPASNDPCVADKKNYWEQAVYKFWHHSQINKLQPNKYTKRMMNNVGAWFQIGDRNAQKLSTFMLIGQANSKGWPRRSCMPFLGRKIACLIAAYIILPHETTVRLRDSHHGGCH